MRLDVKHFFASLFSGELFDGGRKSKRNNTSASCARFLFVYLTDGANGGDDDDDGSKV